MENISSDFSTVPCSKKKKKKFSQNKIQENEIVTTDESTKIDFSPTSQEIIINKPKKKIVRKKITISNSTSLPLSDNETKSLQSISKKSLSNTNFKNYKIEDTEMCPNKKLQIKQSKCPTETNKESMKKFHISIQSSEDPQNDHSRLNHSHSNEKTQHTRKIFYVDEEPYDNQPQSLINESNFSKNESEPIDTNLILNMEIDIPIPPQIDVNSFIFKNEGIYNIDNLITQIKHS